MAPPGSDELIAVLRAISANVTAEVTHALATPSSCVPDGLVALSYINNAWLSLTHGRRQILALRRQLHPPIREEAVPPARRPDGGPIRRGHAAAEGGGSGGGGFGREVGEGRVVVGGALPCN